MERKKPQLTLEFLAVMTMIGVAVAVLVLVIDQQIKKDIVLHATATRRAAERTRRAAERLSHLLAEQKGEGDIDGRTSPAGDTAD